METVPTTVHTRQTRERKMKIKISAAKMMRERMMPASRMKARKMITKKTTEKKMIAGRTTERTGMEMMIIGTIAITTQILAETDPKRMTAVTNTKRIPSNRS